MNGFMHAVDCMAVARHVVLNGVLSHSAERRAKSSERRAKSQNESSAERSAKSPRSEHCCSRDDVFHLALHPVMYMVNGMSA